MFYQPYQRTLRNAVSCTGIGIHTGDDISITLKPAAADTGIMFVRTDLPNRHQVIASYKNVSQTMLGTTISNEDGVEVHTIEHLMAALWGCKIDNCIIEVQGAEIPIMDGSAEPFVFLIECAGVIELSETRSIIEILKPITIEDNGAKISIVPSSGFSINLDIDFGDNVIAQQSARFDPNIFSFKNELCRARTFGFEKEVNKLQSMGLALGASLDNAIAVGEEGVINKEGLRFEREFVKHKILDCIGDLYLAGGFIKGECTGSRSGHATNNKILRAVFKDEEAWKITKLPSHDKASYMA
jgi:UDP-3-O-[3-hydroxymyristoyl] N-acetylglucosamine deacetylase